MTCVKPFGQVVGLILAGLPAVLVRVDPALVVLGDAHQIRAKHLRHTLDLRAHRLRRLDRHTFRCAFTQDAELVQKTLAPILTFLELGEEVGHMPGRIAQRIVLLRVPVRRLPRCPAAWHRSRRSERSSRSECERPTCDRLNTSNRWRKRRKSGSTSKPTARCRLCRPRLHVRLSFRVHRLLHAKSAAVTRSVTRIAAIGACSVLTVREDAPVRA